MIPAEDANPPLRWILKPYTCHNNLTAEELIFNTTLSQYRCIVERGLGMLKTCWRGLHKMLEQNIENILMVTIVCCISHNTFQDPNEKLSDEDLKFSENIIAELQAERSTKRGLKWNSNVCNDFYQQWHI